MKRKLKKIVKELLRKAGLLKSVRRVSYRIRTGKIGYLFKAAAQFEYQILTKKIIFSVADPYSAAFVDYYLLNKTYEPEAVELLNANLGDNDVFVDVGANIGYFSLVVGARSSAIKIFAFEMGSENVQIFNKNLALNNLKNIEVHQVAVADFTGKVFYEDSAVGNAVLKIMTDNKENNPDVVVVESVTLDDFFRERTEKPTVVKIDVEGAEMKVLQGMQQLLSTNIKLLIEIHPKDLIGFGSSREEVLQYLKEQQFQIRPVASSDRKNDLVFAWK
ncbi:MAG: FkbM family methyltransferase [Cytophagales bacterium]|nr:FkbM family methyltransferase [Cytophagales bacterium]